MTVVDLNPLQLVGTLLEAAVFLFEVPTGVMADVYNRRQPDLGQPTHRLTCSN
jgi:hypothetical protein